MSERVVAACEAGETTSALGPGDEPDLLVAVAAEGSGLDSLDAAFEQLRRQSAREAVRRLGRDEGYRLEDTAVFAVRVAPEADGDAIEAWLRRRLGSTCTLTVLRGPGPMTLAAGIRPRAGFSPDRQRYVRDEQGRVRVEAFEIHIAEHCNLRCANCCNMSPFVARHSLGVAEVEAICERMRSVLHADVIKIMGGEPLLHPEIVEIIGVLRRSGVADRVRLFTNGLRLKAMPDAFWPALDEMTISNYVSAPVRPALLELARQRSREHGFVLNIKEVQEFSQVLSPRFVDEETAATTFERCWLRHRCLIVRDGRFYMCTRAAYAPDFLARVEHEPVPAGVEVVRGDDGVDLESEDLAERLERYLNRSEPLGACHYCRGGDGPTLPHHQLTRDEVAAGRMSR
ncbi:MAG: radical SAM protein [Myxococcota bacterium]